MDAVMCTVRAGRRARVGSRFGCRWRQPAYPFDASMQLEDASPYRRDTTSLVLVRAHDAHASSRAEAILAPSEISRVEIFWRGTLSGTETQFE